MNNEEYWTLTDEECPVCGAAPMWVDPDGRCFDCTEGALDE